MRIVLSIFCALGCWGALLHLENPGHLKILAAIIMTFGCWGIFIILNK